MAKIDTIQLSNNKFVNVGTQNIIGLIVAVPAYTAIKVILKEFLSENKIVRQLTKDL
jgi:H+/gluconate symporter-like permease